MALRSSKSYTAGMFESYTWARRAAAVLLLPLGVLRLGNCMFAADVLKLSVTSGDLQGQLLRSSSFIERRQRMPYRQALASRESNRFMEPPRIELRAKELLPQ